MRGFDVLHPMGWDAFGLPAENAAIKHHSHPAKWTYAEHRHAEGVSFKRMGFSYDWDRTVVACDPEYYRWGQWIFLKFWERGLVERRNSPVNWCPELQDRAGQRAGDRGRAAGAATRAVEKRDLTQWYFKITDYAQELLDDLDQLTGWPERVKQQQANWIGRSEGAQVDFTLVRCGMQTRPPRPHRRDVITVFTTRADTLFGCTLLRAGARVRRARPTWWRAAEYEAAGARPARTLPRRCQRRRARPGRPREARRVHRAATCVNPVNGEKVPVWVADYVVADYGTGAVMAVPCGDQRDFEFARKYDLPIIPIILPEDDPLYPELNGRSTAAW